MKTVLIADDDRLARGALKRALSSAGFNVVEAENGKLAFEMADADHPDAIVTDLQMPEMDGQGLLEAARTSSWGKSMPIIMLTGNEDTTAINKALESKVTMYFSKATTSLSEVVDAVTEKL